MYQNDGVIPVRGPADAASPVVVLGVPRGGTSMVAAALLALGVDLGSPDQGNLEDVEFQRAWSKGRGLEKILRERRAGGRRWGVKAPDMIRDLPRVQQHFPDAAYVFVVRDIAAVAARTLPSDAAPARVFARMRSIGRLYDQTLIFLDSSPRPALIVSYAKALERQRAFAEALAAFLGIEGGPPDNVVDEIRAAHLSYRSRDDRDRARRLQGSPVSAGRLP